MIAVIITLSLMSFKTTNEYKEHLENLDNYSVNHEVVYSYILASRADINSEEAQAKWCKLLSHVWKNTGKAVVVEVVTYFFGGNKMDQETIDELLARDILTKL